MEKCHWDPRLVQSLLKVSALGQLSGFAVEEVTGLSWGDASISQGLERTSSVALLMCTKDSVHVPNTVCKYLLH